MTDILEPMLELGSAEGAARYDSYALSVPQWLKVCDDEAQNTQVRVGACGMCACTRAGKHACRDAHPRL